MHYVQLAPNLGTKENIFKKESNECLSQSESGQKSLHLFEIFSTSDMKYLTLLIIWQVVNPSSNSNMGVNIVFLNNKPLKNVSTYLRNRIFKQKQKRI